MKGAGEIWQNPMSALLKKSGLGIEAELPQTAISEDQCVHFWIIETPSGPFSGGVCKLCGKRQQFRNSVYSSAWNKAYAKREDQ